MRAVVGTVFAIVALLMTARSDVCAAAEQYDIPRLEGITVDGSPTDWGERGFRVEMLAADDGQMKTATDFDVSLRLGWNEEGLLLLATVRDDTSVESAEAERLYVNDSLETFIASDKDATSSYIQVIFAPGLDPKTPEARSFVLNRRDGSRIPKPVRVARARMSGGYVLEALYPWESLRVVPKMGAEVWYGLWGNDADQLERTFSVVWAPRTLMGTDMRASHALRLSDQASDPVVATARAQYVHFRRTEVEVLATATRVGDPVEVRAGGRPVGSGRLEEKEGRAHASLSLPLPEIGEPWPELVVEMAGRPVAAISLPDLEEMRAKAVIGLGFSFRPSVFSGAAFPPCDFEDPNLAEDLLGPYGMETTFYDANYRRVLTANEPGRYGAVVKMTPRKGRSRLYFRTLFALPRGMGLGCTAELPSPPGKEAAAVAENAAAINRMVQWCFAEGASRDTDVAALLAAVYESQPGGEPETIQTDAFARDRQWWVGLKRKLYGMEQTYPADFVCPRPKEGEPAPVLRAGTPAEAGMKPDTVGKLDALLTKWAEDSDQSFGVCLARHGVIFLEKAYGERNGRPMALTDKSWMASITKLLAGTAMMMAVDQGRVGLDDPVSKYLPPFREVKTNKELTLRDLYYHLNNLWDHWGDDRNDLEQLLGWYGPRIQVGLAYNYNGLDMALAGKVLELVTGEALPTYYQRHLLAPLGLTHTDVVGSSADARSTPRDMAVLLQMLLNKGAYGDRRFFGEVTWEQMLPVKITPWCPSDATTERGMGCLPLPGEGLSERTWGGAAASSATARIDPANDLIVVMTRNSAGRNFDAYHPQFLKLIGECVVR